MQKKIQLLVLFASLFFPFTGINAFSLPPANDSVNQAIDLGYLASPGLCPNQPKGAYDSLTGTTNNATFNPEQFSVLHCFTSGSPDVWYKFHATGAYFYVEITGSNGLNNFFAKLHYSEGSSIDLVPANCYVSSAGEIIASFPTPTLYGEYYLEIGGDSPSSTGDFFMLYKTYNECAGCVKKATIDLSPAPVFGRYNPGDTVTMCLTVDRWESLTTSFLHGIVPVFGTDWDLNSLTPIMAPATAGVGGGNWNWFTNIPSPFGNVDGYFFETTTDNNPSNNAGDNGNILSSWTGCWKIRALPTCVNQDLAVHMKIFSDAETGNGSQFSICGPYDVIEANISSSCCVGPYITTSSVGGCASMISTISVYPHPVNLTHQFNYFLLDTGMNVLQSATGVIGPVNFINLQPGTYVVWSVDLNNGSCTSYESVTILPAMSIALTQTATGCGTGTGEALVTVTNGGLAPFTYNWLNIPSINQNDSVAFLLQDGWVSVVVTDMTGCSVTDSIFITSQSTPDPVFSYGGGPHCANVDTIPVLTTPPSLSGVFTLVSPTSVGILVDATNGSINISNCTLSGSYFIYVSYTIGGLCPASFVDSIEVVPVPNAPFPLGNAAIMYCPGDPTPVLTVTIPFGTVAFWYDASFNLVSVGNSYTPPINGSTAPGSYAYGVVDVESSGANCSSAVTFFVINVFALPMITTSNDSAICSGDTTTLFVTGCPTCTYLWTPTPTSGINSSPLTFTAPTSTTNYFVYATDASGCSTSGSVNISVNACSQIPGVHIYHGLTPNNDSHNDTWYIDGVDSLSGCAVSIFNRWGVLVWETRNYDNTVHVFKGDDQNGQALTDGTYYYTISVGEHSDSGWIELSH